MTSLGFWVRPDSAALAVQLEGMATPMRLPSSSSKMSLFSLVKVAVSRLVNQPLEMVSLAVVDDGTLYLVEYLSELVVLYSL